MINEPTKDFWDFLEAVNSLHGVNLPSYREAMMEAGVHSFEHPGDKINVVIAGLFILITRHPVLYKYLAGSDEIPKTDFEVENIVGKYEQFWQNRTLLLRILERKDKAQKDDKKRIWVGMNDFLTTVYLTEDGRIEFETSIGDVLKSVNPHRIKVCSVCNQNIFWAKRTDAKYCSKKCSNLYNTRKYLADPQKRESHNEKRKITYQSKKELKEGKKRKINGNL